MRCFFPVLFFITILSSPFYSCSNSEAIPPPPDSQTQVFANYLAYNFNDSIVSARHVYIVISKKDSRENISIIMNKIRPQLLLRDERNFSTIISSAVPLADSLLPPGKIKTDWDGAIDKLDLPLSGVTIIRTIKNKIVNVFSVSAGDIEHANDLFN
jgi:hypothetical protein